MSIPAIDWPKTLGNIALATDFLGDAVTVLVGALTLYGIAKYRKKVSATFRALRLEHMSERRKEITNTLDLIAGSIVKGKALDARALFGALDGQMRALCSIFPEFSELQKEVSNIAHNNAPLTEAIKQRIVHQVKAEFETYKLNSMKELGGEQK